MYGRRCKGKSAVVWNCNWIFKGAWNWWTIKEIGTKDQTSPVSIGKGNDVISLAETQKLTPIDISKYNLDETLYQDLDEEETPIEFTDFERQGEEDAIISYEELIKNTHLAATREERFNTEIEDDSEFLKELKSFRKGM